ncbi:MAG: CPBP family intramembrane metalloprotease [Scytonema sp. CRU_2_7]|nr:CPBP family intramembrane metalloprotease [Scytonema sp. CRU_2_7]
MLKLISVTTEVKPSLLNIVIVTLLNSTILLAVLIGIGLILANRVGLRLPILESWFGNGQPVNWKMLVLIAIAVGVGLGILLSLIDVLAFTPYTKELKTQFPSISLWKQLLAGFSAGINEELQMRLFLFSLIVWALSFLWKANNGSPATGTYWVANVIVALIFGLGHLPITASFTPLTLPIVLRAILLNGIAGVTFGYLYWQQGLEAAILAHMSTDFAIAILNQWGLAGSA